MLPATLQFVIAMIACAINERMQRSCGPEHSEIRRPHCNKREFAEGNRPAPDFQQGPGAISLDACQPHPAVIAYDHRMRDSSAKNATHAVP